MKPVRPRAAARTDIDLAVDHYRDEAGAEIALRFVDALEQAYTRIGETPAAGSPRWSHELNLPGLRSAPINGFPWRIFYMELEAYVDVWRVLHARRDIPGWLSDADGL
ncbi:type II toxin-antitoxin system RelE/ParE family toxin [Sandaracinobacteroides hominis]|uniref:type II toxin-antitoxin system RelE/ParE family toxin n=1 Tax=Sandaracinobacteroides hominis TaxID=2780086 RepID=UPI0018F5EE46|nr:type II toxin-antitoxin system RelE/ParE family toxin [Sandaracinobacteroides hominis]